MDKLTKFIKEVLLIIDYNGDRQKFSDTLIQIINLKTFQKLYEELDEKDRNNAKKLMELPQENVEALGNLFKNSFGQSKIDQVLTITTREVLLDYFKEIIPSLSGEQKSKLQNFLSSFNL